MKIYVGVVGMLFWVVARVLLSA